MTCDAPIDLEMDLSQSNMILSAWIYGNKFYSTAFRGRQKLVGSKKHTYFRNLEKVNESMYQRHNLQDKNKL